MCIRDSPTLLIFPILAVASLLTVRVMIWADNLLGAWFFSALFIITVTFFGVLGMYPGIIISSIDPAYSVTVFNGASSQLTLKIMLGVTPVSYTHLDVYKRQGMYVGYDQPRTMGRSGTGGSMALPIFVEYAKSAFQAYPPDDFEVPDGISFANVDQTSGCLLYTSRCV